MSVEVDGLGLGRSTAGVLPWLALAVLSDLNVGDVDVSVDEAAATCVVASELRHELLSHLPEAVGTGPTVVHIRRAADDVEVEVEDASGFRFRRTLQLVAADCPLASRLIAHIVARQLEAESAMSLPAAAEATPVPPSPAPAPVVVARPVAPIAMPIESAPMTEIQPALLARVAAGGAVVDTGLVADARASVGAVFMLPTAPVGATLGLEVATTWPVALDHGAAQLDVFAVTMGGRTELDVADDVVLSLGAGAAAGGGGVFGVDLDRPRATVVPWVSLRAETSILLKGIGLVVGLELPMVVPVFVAEDALPVGGPRLLGFVGVELRGGA
jgi:hypothetical protein